MMLKNCVYLLLWESSGVEMDCYSFFFNTKEVYFWSGGVFLFVDLVIPDCIALKQ